MNILPYVRCYLKKYVHVNVALRAFQSFKESSLQSARKKYPNCSKPALYVLSILGVGSMALKYEEHNNQMKIYTFYHKKYAFLLLAKSF